MPHTLHVVSHTHWDREWYLTFQQFRMRLVDLIDHLLDLLDRDPEFLSFHLDAQTIVLEDYLQIRPHQREQVARYIREGRIIVGPWYQLNDEYLTSGEATIRSLLVGMRIAWEFGTPASIGYLPDQFGNISQMPQIFRGFGIDNAVFGRGYQLVDERKMEFLWQSPDGSQVTASLMAFWYNNAQHIPKVGGINYLMDLRERMAEKSAVSHLLLMNGVDHLEAQADLSASLAAVRSELPEDSRVVHSTVEQYIDAVKEEVAARGISLQTFAGELREDRGGSCLAGTLSTRMYIKQANHHAQITLEKYAEPFAGFAMLLGCGYPHDILHYAWKLLMQNHPHDSICGCSIDQVHREMMPRFAQVEQVGAELVGRSLRQIGERVKVDGTALVVFNPLNWARTDLLRANLTFPLGPATRGNPPRDESKLLAGIAITDEHGDAVPFAVTASETRIRQVLSPVELPLDQWVQDIAVEFVAHNVPACGYKTYRITAADDMPNFVSWQPEDEPAWIPVLEDVGDVGDEYLYKPPMNDERLVRPLLDGQMTEEGNAVRRTQTYTATWDLPAAALDDLSGRTAERVTCDVVMRVTRWRGCPRVEYETTIFNRARDHRMRVVFQNAGERFIAKPYSIAEGQFDVLKRPLENPMVSEGAASFYPQQNWVALEGTDQTVSVINNGLPEYEIYTGGESPEIAVTLLRSVQQLARRGDGPAIETPEAQCLGEHSFRFALFQSGGGWEDGRVWQQAHQFNAPLAAVQVDGSEAGELPASLSFITVEPEELVVTAIKRAEDDPGRLVIRLYNISEQPVQGAKVMVRGARSAQVLNLNEAMVRVLEMGDDGSVALERIRQKEIVTLGFDIP